MPDKPTLLIVDDKIENLLTLEGLLECFDVNLVRATSGEEALAHTLDHDFALVLLDVQMPRRAISQLSLSLRHPRPMNTFLKGMSMALLITY